MNRSNIGWGILIIDLVVVTAGVGYLLFKSQTVVNPTVSEATPGTNKLQASIQDDTTKRIDQLVARVTELEQKKAVPEPGVVITPAVVEKTTTIVKTVPKTKTRMVSYMTIPGLGNTMANSWQDLSGTDFYFDKADHPGLVDVYFEANMKLFNGNGMAYIRLLDVTHGIGVQGSEINTNSQIDTLLTSGKLTFWAGKNLIRVQAKSLTADTTIYNYGRLKITTEN